MMIAQITDMHIKPEGVLAYGRFDTAPYLGRAVEHLLALKPRPDVVLATGDLVDGGLPEERAHRGRPPASPDPVARRRDSGEHRAEHGASGRARPRGAAPGVHDGAAGLPAPRLERRDRPGQPHELHRRLRRAILVRER